MASKLKHLHYILEIIRNNNGISKKDLLDKLELYGSPTAERTLERDFSILRDQYEVDIQYRPSARGYVISDESNPNIRTFENFAKTQVLGGILNDMLSNGVRVWDVVDIDDQVPIMNIEHIQQLIEAVLDKKKVRIKYLKFFEKEPETYELEPHLIRQALKRWYLIAGDTSTNPPTLKTFGLERIISIERLNSWYKPQTRQIKELCKTVYGISHYQEPRELVVLETNRWQGKYWETLPIHASQQIEYISKETSRIKLNVVINQELLQLLASQSQTLNVISPEKLKVAYKEFILQKVKDLD